jgi:hypothetical protein
MKIAPDTIQPFNREPAKPSTLRAHAVANPAVGPGTPSSANAAGQASDSAKPAKAVDTGGQKAAPPGLERVLARLQGLPERNTGQANSLDRINRNIARYVETQALGKSPAAAPVAPKPGSVSDTVAATNATEPLNTAGVAPPPGAAPAGEPGAGASSDATPSISATA